MMMRANMQTDLTNAKNMSWVPEVVFSPPALAFRFS